MKRGFSLVSPRFKQASLIIFPLLLVAAFGITHIHDPFTGDQALYLIGAKEIAGGAVLYVDYWCDKQPGNYLFFLAGGTLFGFSEEGVHTFELLYLLLLAIVMIKILGPHFRHPWLAGLAPLSTIGVYYATVDPWLLTQLEMIVSFPILISLWLSSINPSSTKKSVILMILSGVFAGITVIFKLILAPIFPVVLLISSILFLRKKYMNLKETVLYRLIPAALGVILILGIVSLWFWRHNALRELIWVAFVYPLKAVAENETAPFSRLLKYIIATGKICSLWLGLACVGLYRWIRTKHDMLTPVLFTWVASAALIVLAQRLSWWHYHFLLFYAPVGILGIGGVDELLRLCPKHPRCARISKHMLVGGLVLLASIPSLWLWHKHVRTWISERPFVDMVHKQAFQFKKSKTYENIWYDTRFLVTPDAIPGPIYVFGDPTYLYLAGRTYSAPIHGWTDFTRELWDKLYSQICLSSPPYIFVSDVYNEMIEGDSPRIKSWIERDYDILKNNFEGTWYMHKRIL